MSTVITDISRIPPIDHDEAMRLASAEYDRLLEVVDHLEGGDWSRRTDCPGWDVKAVLAHLLGMMKLNADPAEAARQHGLAGPIAAERGCFQIDALTDLQVREHAHLSTAELAAALHAYAGPAVEGRRVLSEQERAEPFPTGIPGEDDWTRGFLVDVILTRDPWMHRVDICRATGKEMALSAGHDGRLVADVAAQWAHRHGQPVVLRLDGHAGGVFNAGSGGPELRLDAVEFTRILSGRSTGPGLLATPVPF